MTQVVRLGADDAPAYRALMLHGYEHAADAFTSTPQERADAPLAWWEQRVADPVGLCAAWGARADGKLVGAVALEFSAKPKTRHKAHLIGMYVLQDQRGQGLGRQLLDQAVAHARARADIASIVLTVTEGNAGAVALYQAGGFRIFGNEPMAILTPSGYRAKLHMWMPLLIQGVAAENSRNYPIG